MTIFEAVKKGEAFLAENGISEYRNDAWLLFSYLTGMNRTGYFMKKDNGLPDDQAAQYHKLLEMRAQKIPLQYITHTAFFMGYEFYVNEHVLIPRQDTEVLVEQAAKLVREDDDILDMCTGSGCILLSLLLRTKAGGGTGCDISEPALYVAAENAQRLGVTNVHFVQGNLFEQIHDTYDMIVSNPPYIRTDVIAGLMEEVIGHEPYLALNGHEDGLYFYRRITKESVCFLKNGGYLCYEIGYDQAADVADIMKNNDFEEIRVIKDLAGLDRVVIGRRRN